MSRLGSPGSVAPNYSCLHAIRTFCPRQSTNRAQRDFGLAPISAARGGRFNPVEPYATKSRTVKHPRHVSAPSKASKAGEPSRLALRRQLQDPQFDDIVPGDLSATLAAHQRSNERNYFRFTYAENLKSPDASATEDTTTLASVTSPAHQNLADLGDEAIKQGTLRAPSLDAPPVVPLLDLPWETKESSNWTDRRKRLNTEIGRFSEWIKPTAEEREFCRLAAFQDCYKLNKALPEAYFELGGSQTTGLATPFSDIDILFRIKDFEEKAHTRGHSLSLGQPTVRRRIYRLLRRIRSILAASSRFEKLYTVPKARHPLVAMHHVGANIECQIVYRSGPDQGVAIVQEYLEEYPQLQPIYLLIQTALVASGLGSRQPIPGVSSHPLFMMIVASYRHKRLSPTGDDLVSGLEAFLEFYRDLDFSSNCISLEPPILFPKRDSNARPKKIMKEEMQTNLAYAARFALSIKVEDKPDQLVLQDPVDMERNVTRALEKPQELQSFCKQTLRDFNTWLENGKRANDTITPMEQLLSEAVSAITEKRAAFKTWVDSDAGKQRMEELQEFYDKHSKSYAKRIAET